MTFDELVRALKFPPVGYVSLLGAERTTHDQTLSRYTVLAVASGTGIWEWTAVLRRDDSETLYSVPFDCADRPRLIQLCLAHEVRFDP